MLLINAYCPSFFPSLFSPSRLYIYSLPAPNNCLLSIFLSVTSLALLTLFSPIFTPHLSLAGNYLINAYVHLSFRHFPSLSVTFLALPAFTCITFHVSNKCLLPIFLSVNLLLLPPLHVACMLLINAYCPSFFPSLSSPSPLFRPFSSYINITSHVSNKCVLHIFLSVTFLALPAFTCIAFHASNKCLLPIFSFRHFSHPSRLYIYIACLFLINAYCSTFFPSLFSPFSPFFHQFLRHI
jgi:hypothetical protein